MTAATSATAAAITVPTPTMPLPAPPPTKGTTKATPYVGNSNHDIYALAGVSVG